MFNVTYTSSYEFFIGFYLLDTLHLLLFMELLTLEP